jgi:hypothetical protein
MLSSTRASFDDSAPTADRRLAVSRAGFDTWVLFAAVVLTGLATRKTYHLVPLACCHGVAASDLPGSGTREQQVPI